MFGTMVVQLPSKFEGGTVRVRHGNRQEEFDLSAGSEHGFGHVAFYTDCLHEVAPITAGRRLCLVYNLVREASSRAPVVPPSLELVSLADMRRAEAAAKKWSESKYAMTKTFIVQRDEHGKCRQRDVLNQLSDVLHWTTTSFDISQSGYGCWQGEHNDEPDWDYTEDEDWVETGGGRELCLDLNGKINTRILDGDKNGDLVLPDYTCSPRAPGGDGGGAVRARPRRESALLSTNEPESAYVAFKLNL